MSIADFYPIVAAVCACLILATSVMAIAFKAKNDLPTTRADVKKMALWSGEVAVIVVLLAAALVVLP